MTASILVIDDNREYREIIGNILSDHGYDVWEASCPEHAYSFLKDEEPDLIICDLHMPFTFSEKRGEFMESPVVGIKTLKELATVFPDKPLIAITATMSPDLKTYARDLAPIPTLPKPFQASDLIFLVESQLGSYTKRSGNPVN